MNSEADMTGRPAAMPRKMTTDVYQYIMLVSGKVTSEAYGDYIMRVERPRCFKTAVKLIKKKKWTWEQLCDDLPEPDFKTDINAGMEESMKGQAAMSKIGFSLCERRELRIIFDKKPMLRRACSGAVPETPHQYFSSVFRPKTQKMFSMHGKTEIETMVEDYHYQIHKDVEQWIDAPERGQFLRGLHGCRSFSNELNPRLTSSDSKSKGQDGVRLTEEENNDHLIDCALFLCEVPQTSMMRPATKKKAARWAKRANLTIDDIVTQVGLTTVCPAPRESSKEDKALKYVEKVMGQNPCES